MILQTTGLVRERPNCAASKLELQPPQSVLWNWQENSHGHVRCGCYFITLSLQTLDVEMGMISYTLCSLIIPHARFLRLLSALSMTPG